MIPLLLLTGCTFKPTVEEFILTKDNKDEICTDDSAEDVPIGSTVLFVAESGHGGLFQLKQGYNYSNSLFKFCTWEMAAPDVKYCTPLEKKSYQIRMDYMTQLKGLETICGYWND